MRFLGSCLLALAVLAPGCVIDDDYEDGLIELRPSMKEAELTVGPGGAGALDFTFHYEFGVVDAEGIPEVRWRYSLMTKDRVVLAEVEEQMRKPEAEGVTQILVQGDRTRTLEVPAGLNRGATYILWVETYYRDEVLAELLHRVEDPALQEARPLD